MNNRKIEETELAMLINNRTMVDYLDRLRMLATSLFTWKGLDEVAGTGASRFLEQALYENGRACFVKDDKLGYMALKVNPSDKLNVYMLPTKVTAWSVGYNKQYDFDDIVYIMNNEIQKPTLASLELFAMRLYETERTIDVNLKAQKTPVLIEGDTKTILTLKNVYMQYSGNIPFIFGNKQFDISNKLNVLKTDAPYLIDKLDIHKHQVFNDELTENFDLEMILRKFGMSLRTFYREWKKYYTIPPAQYLIDLRLKYASEQLGNSSKKIYEIAAESGFCDPMYFNHCFSKRYGCSPLAYRKRTK